MLDRLVSSDIDEQRVDLDEAARLVGLEIMRQTDSEAAFGRPAMGSPAQAGNRRHDTAFDQALENASDASVRDGKTAGAQERAELGFAPHRIIEPQRLNGANQQIGPGLGPYPARSPERN